MLKNIKSLSIVIPAYKEEKRIKKTIEKIINYLKSSGIKFEIIVVDDCSKDNTIKVVKSLNKKIIILKNKINRGKGYSVKKGIMHAKKEYVLFSDADLSTPIEELKKFDAFVPEYDIIIASRNMPDSNITKKQPSLRTLLGKIFPILVNLLVIRGIKDTQCGFKLFKTKIAKKIVKLQTIDRFCFDAEILYIGKKKRLKIKEVGVRWENSEESKLRIHKDIPNMLMSLFKIMFNNLKGRYN